jgi:hypothetical protein
MADGGLSRLTDDEKIALLALLKRAIADDRYPFSPRIRRCEPFWRSWSRQNRRRRFSTPAAVLRAATRATAKQRRARG